MNPYPKRILTIPQQLQSYTDAGMTISSVEEATAALTTIGYYRLRGYSFHLYDNASRQYRPGTDFSDILNPIPFRYGIIQTSFRHGNLYRNRFTSPAFRRSAYLQ